MIDYMLMPFRRYAQTSGRSRRKEYWAYILLNLLVYGGLVVIAMAMGMSADALDRLSDMGSNAERLGPGFALLAGLGLLFFFATFVPNIAVAVRRLHDRNMSGWWYLGFVFLGAVPFVGWIVSIAFLVVLALPGTPGPNRFGEDPKDPAGAEVFA